MRWRALYERCFTHGVWTCELPDARLVSSLGAHLAIEGKDFVQAETLCLLYLSHRDCVRFSFDSGHFLSLVGAAIYCQLRFEDAVAQWGTPLDASTPWQKVSDRRSYLLILRGHMLASLQEVGLGEAADRSTREFVERVTKEFRGFVRKSRTARLAKSNEDLYDLLESTFPSR